MIIYEVKFDDGESIMSTTSRSEAEEYRAKNNFRYISRSIHIWVEYYSKVPKCKLHKRPIRFKLM